jgi:hypothetical protein
MLMAFLCFGQNKIEQWKKKPLNKIKTYDMDFIKASREGIGWTLIHQTCISHSRIKVQNKFLCLPYYFLPLPHLCFPFLK